MVKTHFQQWPSFRSPYYDEYFATTGVVLQLKTLTETLRPYFSNEVMPNGFTFEAEQAVYDEYSVDIDKLVSQKLAAWITGESDVDADWDAYLAQLEAMGFSELVAGYQAQYDRLIGK